MTDEVREAIAKFQEKQQKKLSNREQASVSRCLSGKKDKGIKVDDQAIAICISESRKSKTKMTEPIYHVVYSNYTNLYPSDI